MFIWSSQAATTDRFSRPPTRRGNRGEVFGGEKRRNVDDADGGGGLERLITLLSPLLPLCEHYQSVNGVEDENVEHRRHVSS